MPSRIMLSKTTKRIQNIFKKKNVDTILYILSLLLDRNGSHNVYYNKYILFVEEKSLFTKKR